MGRASPTSAAGSSRGEELELALTTQAACCAGAAWTHELHATWCTHQQPQLVSVAHSSISGQHRSAITPKSSLSRPPAPPPPPPSRTLHSLPVAPSRALSQKLSSAKDNTKPLKKRGLKVKEYLHLKGDRGVRKQEGPKRQPNNDCHMSQAARHLDQDARRIRNLALWIRMQSLTVIEITTREIRQANRP